MAGVQGSALAIAVCNAGGLGSLPCAMLNPMQIRSELEIITGNCNRPFNVNFFCHQPRAVDAAREKLWRDELGPFYREYDIDESDIAPAQGRTPFNEAALELLQEFKPAVVSFHFGLPAADLLDAVKATGAMTLCSATTLAEALWLEQHGIDAIIAQGVEAGGHRGMFLSEDLSEQVGIFALLPQIVNASQPAGHRSRRNCRCRWRVRGTAASALTRFRSVPPTCYAMKLKPAPYTERLCNHRPRCTPH